MAEPLTLYYSEFSSCSQRARLSLDMKGLPYKHVTLDITGLETNDPWFVKINPKGQVPVLQHGDKYIPDSVEILTYLDDTFGSTKKVKPDLSSQEGRLIEKFCQACRGLHLAILTYGVQFVPELIEDSQIPEQTQQKMKNFIAGDSLPEKLRKHGEEQPELRQAYVTKQEAWLNFTKFVKNENKKAIVQSEIQKCRALFQEAETQLQQNKDAGKPDMWLCGQDFSLADIEIGIVMRRLQCVGLAKSTWLDGKHPNLENYYKKLSAKQSFRDISLNILPPPGN